MTDAPTTCGRADCDRPADGWYLCRQCARDTERILHDTGWMLDQLDLVTAGHVRYIEDAGKIHAGADVALIYNPHVAKTRDNHVHELLRVARTVRAANPNLGDWPEPADVTPRFAGAWLAIRISALRLHPEAGALTDALIRTWRACVWTIDRPPGKEFLGTCATDWEGRDCGGRIYARAGDEAARCDTCGGEYADINALKTALIERLDSHLATAAEIAELSTYLDLTINRSQVRKQINQWVHRKQLVPVQHAPDVKFRFLEARVLLEHQEKRRQNA